MQLQTSPHSKMAIFKLKMPTVLKRMKNQFFLFLFYELRLIVFTIYGDTPGFSNVSPPTNKSFKSGQIYRNVAQWVEMTEKSIFQFFAIFGFCDMVNFVLKFRKKNYVRGAPPPLTPRFCRQFLHPSSPRA